MTDRGVRVLLVTGILTAGRAIGARQVGLISQLTER